mgnify:CR=1 FL=1
MRHQDDYSIRDNYIDNAEHFGHDPLYDYRDQLDEGHVSQGDTSGPEFEYARRAVADEDLAGSIKDSEHEFWEERHLGDERKKWAENMGRTGSWKDTKNRKLRSIRTSQSKSRKKS